MSLVATALDGSAATFEFNGNSHFGFEVTRCFLVVLENAAQSR